jgi:sigma-B regulation protein RsbU (phosphoserine phosphatase)
VLKLGDFSHLPQLDVLVERLVADGPGLIVVAGLDLPPTTTLTADDGFLPSGRSAIFGIVMRELLTAHPSARAVVVAEDKAAVRIPRQLRRRVQLSLVRPPQTHADWIADAVRRQPDLLVIDHLCAETAPAALEAAQKGLRVLSQFNTVFRGAGVARHLFDLGAPREQLDSLSWILTVQRMATLCPHCKQSVTPDPAQLDELRRRYPDFDVAESYHQADGCSHCRHTGRHGNMAVFDVFCADADGPHLFERASLLSLEEYMLHLAALGHLALDDLLRLEADQFRHTYNLLVASENALTDAIAALGRKLAELEAANRVLQQRTEALISLQGIGQALTTSTDLEHLATRVCRRARDMCGADRAILYLLRSADEAEVLAVGGWNPALLHQQVNAALVGGADAVAEPKPFAGRPPGVPSHLTDDEDVTLRAGLYVPLVAQRERVGTMIVHSTKKSRFTPGEAALLQALANQAALAIQRAGLIEELVKKERMEQELELARQVQQSVLPRTFPQIPGFLFAARNEPARRVGGDFYDVIALDADHFGLVIADVSDKGMPAALYMALTRSLLLAESRRDRSPRAVLANVNRLLLELGEPSMFVSVFYGVVENATRRLTYTRAGHDRPLLLREGTIQSLGGKGAVLGFLDQDNLHLSEEEIVLLPGDRLVLYTDGLIDVLAPDGQSFDLGQLESLLQSHASLSPGEMCAATFADLLAYRRTAEQYDDMTMLAVEVK